MTNRADEECLIEWTTTVQVPINLRRLAEIFAAMDDDKQARFFVEVAEIMSKWEGGNADQQMWYVGGHLRNCECSTEGARDLIRSLAAGLERSQHGAKQ